MKPQSKINRLRTASKHLVATAALTACVPSHAEVVLSTDFTGRTVTDKTASDITWAVTGVQDPGDLTWMPEGGGPLDTALFDTADAQNHFAPDMNIGNEGPWSTTIAMELTASQILLEEVVLDWQHFNNGGAFQGVARSADWSVTVTGSVSGELGSITATNVTGMSGIETLGFAPPLLLTNAETFELKIFVNGTTNTGNNTGLNAMTVNGVVNTDPDNTAPTISALSPDNSATDVQTNSDLTITFDEVVRKGAGNIVIFDASDDSVLETIDVAGDSVTVDGAEVTIDPATNLTGLTGFYVRIDAGALEDLSGNAFSGISDDATWGFTTGEADTTAPAVTSLSPADNEVEVAPGVDLILTFDEEVQAGNGNIEVRLASNDSVAESIDAASAAVAVDGAEVTVALTSTLSRDTRYYINIDAGAFEDLSSNPFTGMADDSTWNFTTAAGPTIVLSTDFAGRTVDGKTASNIPWLVNGVQDPGDLTWVLEGGGPANTSLFDTANSQGHFAPDLNVENEGPWSVTIPLELAVSQVVLEEVILDWRHFNNAGAFQSVNRSADWTVSVTGSASGEIGSVTAANVNAMFGVESLVFPTPVVLNRTEIYEVKIFVVGNGPGNNTGLNAITFIGQVGPGQPFRFAVDQDGAELLFEWESQDGMLYNLRTSTDLASELSTWSLIEGDIPATPPTNMKAVARPGDPLRFYRVEEFPAPPVAILSDDFEAGIGDWTVGSDGADGTAWELGQPANVGPSEANSPLNCFGTNIASDYALDANVWLRSPAIDLTEVSEATLHYAQFKDIEEGFDFASVAVLDAADNSQLAVIESAIDGISTDWEDVTHSVPAEALGRSVQIEFRFESDEISNFAGWYIDDVVVTVP